MSQPEDWDGVIAPSGDEETTNVVDRLMAVLLDLGKDRYGGEEISQLTHGLQCATLALRDGASESLVTAALLHDIGHLVNPKDQGAAARGIDAAHERVGAAYLSRWFGPEVTAPINLHVAAKRYLCSTEEGYFQRLSAQSVQSLAIQGGPFPPMEVERFLSQPFAEMAVALRRWDEAAKDPAMSTPSLQAFRPKVERALMKQADDDATV